MIPKGDYLTVCLLGEDLNKDVLMKFLALEEVSKCFPPGWTVPEKFCRCRPKMNVGGGVGLFADRIVFIGDSGVCRLFKDGLGSAYRTAKAAASTIVFRGFSKRDFRKEFLPICRGISTDNAIGRLLFFINGLLQKFGPTRRAVLRMVLKEHSDRSSGRRMSGVLWDMFTGSTGYTDVFRRAISPSFWLRLMGHIVFLEEKPPEYLEQGEVSMHDHTIGRIFEDGEAIVTQGEKGECAWVIQSGSVDVFRELDGEEVHLATLDEGEIIGEMALFDSETRSATIRARGRVRALSIDKKTILRRVHEDPTFALRFLEKMSLRLRNLDREYLELKTRLNEAEKPSQHA
jgi:CRP-like cAMP-binding protein